MSAVQNVNETQYFYILKSWVDSPVHLTLIGLKRLQT